MEAAAARAVVRVNVGVAAHAGVDQQEPAGMVDEVAQARLHLRRAGTGLRGWAHEVAEVDAVDCQICHRMSVPARRPVCRAEDGRGHPVIIRCRVDK